MPRPLIQRLAVTVTVAAATAGVVGLVAGGASAGEPRADAGPARPDGGADAAPRRIWINGPPPPPAIVITKTPPDPTPSRTRAKWVFDLKYDHGSPYLMAVRRLELAAPEDAPRMMGRIALELDEGPTLIERVRFDVPRLGVPEPDAGFGAPPRIEPQLVTRVGVFFPAHDKGTRLELWDRATDRRWTLPWPPAATVASPPSASDAGPPGEVDGGAP